MYTEVIVIPTWRLNQNKLRQALKPHEIIVCINYSSTHLTGNGVEQALSLYTFYHKLNSVKTRLAHP